MGLIGRGGPAPRRRARSLEAGLLLLRLRAAHARTRPLASGFFGICGGRTRRAASSRAASGCATGAARRAAPRGRVGVASGFVGVRAEILAFGARGWPLASSASAAAARGARRRTARRRAARRARRVELRRAVASVWLLGLLACARRFWLLARAAGLWLLRHPRRPRAARGVEPRGVGLRYGRGASSCAARSRIGRVGVASGVRD